MKSTQYYIKSLLMACALVMAVSACTDGFEEMNTNPNAPTAVGANILLPNAIESAVDRYWGFTTRNERINIDHAMSWVGYFTRNIYAEEGDNYNVQPSVNISNWQGFYADGLINFQKILEISAADGAAPHANYRGIAMVMRAWVFSTITDIWGAAPYQEALLGANAENKVLSPTYDSQAEIYAGIIEELKQANALLSTTGPAVRGDILFNGNVMMWKRFANTLRFRLLNRQAHKVATSKTEMQAMLADPATYPMISSNAENVMLRYGTLLPSNNPWQQVFIEDGRTDWNMSSVLVDKLKSMGDTRLTAYAQPGPQSGGVIQGHPNGLPDAVATQFLMTSATVNAANFAQRNSPGIILTYSEHLFNMAEAALEGDITGNAQALFEQAVTASFAQYNLAVPAGYIAQMGSVSKENIMTQKWIALFGQGIEAWTELRRTGFPVMPAKDPRAIFRNDGVLPTRLTYPATEYSLNGANIEAGIQLNGGPDDMKIKMWWAE